MRILSSSPADLAKISDLVERDVTSGLEVSQSTLFPLLQFPSPLRHEPTAGVLPINQSCMTDTYNQVTNAVGQITNIGKLTKGIWEITATVNYSSTYRQFITTGYLLLLADLVTGLSHVIAALATTNTTETMTIKVRITLDREDLVLQTQLGQNTVGQDHFSQTVCYLAKLF